MQRASIAKRHRRTRSAKARDSVEDVTGRSAGLRAPNQAASGRQRHGGRNSRLQLILRRCDQVVQQFPMRAYGKTRKRDEVVHIGNSVTFAGSCRHTCVLCVSGTGKQLIERRQTPLIAAGGMLRIDLLEAEDIGLQTFKGGPQDLRTHLERPFAFGGRSRLSRLKTASRM